jgi:hypothetical protein
VTIDLIVLDVGNADSMLVLPTGTSALVIDIPAPRHAANWLKAYERDIIDCIYITHAHDDHTPPLTTLVRFIENWLKTGIVRRICLPVELLYLDLESLPDSPHKKSLESAMQQLLIWERGRSPDGVQIEFIPGIRGIGPSHYGDVTIHCLHPPYIFGQTRRHTHPKQLNEVSLVLRLDYGDFRALLLADVEGEGLAALLDVCSDDKADELRCHIMKVPHHGAWNPFKGAIYTLLDRADPELAILSVGSTNSHGHVRPQLFAELLRRKYDKGKRLRQFICTEVTRTCKLAAVDRKGKDALSSRLPCAGDIVITVDPSGTWQQQHAIVHMHRIETFTYAACVGRAELIDKD